MEKSRYFRKIRKLTHGNKTGDAYGITIPRALVNKFSNTSMHVYSSGNAIIIESGALINKGKIGEYNDINTWE